MATRSASTRNAGLFSLTRAGNIGGWSTPSRLENKIDGGIVVLSQIQYGKFAGRVVARVETLSGEDLSAALLAAGLARPYAGGARTPWCDTAELVE